MLWRDTAFVHEGYVGNKRERQRQREGGREEGKEEGRQRQRQHKIHQTIVCRGELSWNACLTCMRPQVLFSAPCKLKRRSSRSSLNIELRVARATRGFRCSKQNKLAWLSNLKTNSNSGLESFQCVDKGLSIIHIAVCSV